MEVVSPGTYYQKKSALAGVSGRQLALHDLLTLMVNRSRQCGHVIRMDLSNFNGIRILPEQTGQGNLIPHGNNLLSPSVRLEK
jgi:hypothetical protein